MAQPVIRSRTSEGSTPWVVINNHNDPVNFTVDVQVSGTVNYTVQQTYSDVLGTQDYRHMAFNDAVPAPVVLPSTFNNLVGATTAQQAVYTNPVMAVRLTVNSGDGTATMTVLQAGIKGG